jgi:branched-chain amino acid transport system ATP-binding protein
VLLEVDSLDVRYGRNHAVKSLSLSVGADELVAVVGSNGAGKTSLLRALQGLAPIAGGQIVFDGVDITGMSPSQRLRQGLALVPEGRQIVLGLSVHENLQMGVYCRTDNDTQRDIDAIYDRFPNLAARRRMRASVLSGGEQQMLAIGRAMLAKPKLMMLDEPSLGLSPLFVQYIFEIIDRLHAEGLTILLVEQNLNLTLRHAKRCYVLERGQVTVEGEADIVRNDPRTRSAYLGL